MEKKKIIIVNDKDEIIGYKERGTLEPNDIYRVSGLWIQNSKGEILLAQRSFSKKHDPGKWGPAVAGTNDEGETYESNIIKEAEEEIGLKDCHFEKLYYRMNQREHTYFVQSFFVVVDKEIEDFTIQKEEVEQIKWFTYEELEKELKDSPDNFLKSVKEYIELHYQK